MDNTTDWKSKLESFSEDVHFSIEFNTLSGELRNYADCQANVKKPSTSTKSRKPGLTNKDCLAKWSIYRIWVNDPDENGAVKGWRSVHTDNISKIEVI